MFARINGKNVSLLMYYRKYMEVRDIVYINAINLNKRDIDTLKYLIEVGCLAPITEELRKVVKPNVMGDFMSGYWIFPQMYYIKLQ